MALPKELEEIEPSFHHITEKEIPSWEEFSVKIKLIAGEAFGKKSPVPVHSSLYFIEIKSEESQKLEIGNELFGESALYILEGHITTDGNQYSQKQILIAKNSQLCSFEIGANSTIYIFGGTPFPEERFINWNFVSSRKERIEKAKEDWIQQKFPKIPNETGFVPYPSL